MAQRASLSLRSFVSSSRISLLTVVGCVANSAPVAASCLGRRRSGARRRRRLFPLANYCASADGLTLFAMLLGG